MATLSQAKTLGEVGSLLVLVGGFVSFVIPAGGLVVPIAGLILTVIAIKYISEVVQTPSIFTNIVIGIAIAIVGAIVFFVIVIASVLKDIGLLTSLTSTTTITSTSSLPSGVIGLAEDVLIGVAVLWILFIVSSIFVRRGYKQISEKLNVGLFGTAALLYLIGAILTIILVGLIIIFVAQILLLVAFFSISDIKAGWSETTTYPPPPPSMQQQPPPPMGGSGGSQTWGTSRTCPKCGAPVAQDAVFCPSCGSNLSQ